MSLDNVFSNKIDIYENTTEFNKKNYRTRDENNNGINC
jgi:hypothetical protein